MKRLASLLMALLVLLCGCAAGEGGSVRQPDPSASESSRSLTEAPESSQPLPESEPAPELPTPQEYIRSVADGCAAEFCDPSMTEYERVKAAYDWLIERGTYTSPVALDVWRFRSEGGSLPSYVENRSLSMLLWGLGTCEDYAAALYMLLTSMGLEARYIPGATYTSDGPLCDHAWNQVRIDGVWYNLDCELDAGIRKNGVVTYRYFLDSDETMSASHFWGQRLIDAGLLRPDQNEEIAESYLGETCPLDHPKPEAKTITSRPEADRDAIERELRQELADYEAVHGKLLPMEIERTPPVFGRYGGYNRNALSWYDEAAFRESDAETVLIR